jgi:hypothetical protein
VDFDALCTSKSGSSRFVHFKKTTGFWGFLHSTNWIFRLLQLFESFSTWTAAIFCMIRMVTLTMAEYSWPVTTLEYLARIEVFANRDLTVTNSILPWFGMYLRGSALIWTTVPLLTTSFSNTMNHLSGQYYASLSLPKGEELYLDRAAFDKYYTAALEREDNVDSQPDTRSSGSDTSRTTLAHSNCISIRRRCMDGTLRSYLRKANADMLYSTEIKSSFHNLLTFPVLPQMFDDFGYLYR